MHFPFHIAKRYFISRKSHSAINIIALISVLGVTVSTTALIVVLSVYNGLEDFIGSLYNSFDADVRVTPAQGKTFNTADFPFQELEALPAFKSSSRCIEEVMLLKYGENWVPATVKGVEEAYLKMSDLEPHLVDGSLLLLEQDSIQYCILGSGVRQRLDVGLMVSPILFHAPLREGNFKRPEEAFHILPAIPAGVFNIAVDYNHKYVLVSFELAQALLHYQGEISALELEAVEGQSPSALKEEVTALLGADYTVKTRYEQNELLYQTSKAEKWISFLVLLFILLVATFNILASLTMLMIDKKKDMFILNSMGAHSGMIRSIFTYQGLFINVLGLVVGLVLGIGLCWAQEKFQLILLADTLQHYPVKVVWSDVLVILLTVLGIGMIGTYLPVWQLTKRYFRNWTNQN